MVLDFYNENAHRSYPLLSSDDLPHGALVGMSILLPTSGVPYLREVVYNGAVLSVVVALNGVDVLAGDVPVAPGQINATATFTSLTPGASGFFVAGPYLEPGTWQMDETTGELDPLAYTDLTPTAIKSLNTLTDIVNLLEGNSDIVIELINNVVRISLSDDALERYLSTCDRTVGSSACGRPYITNINGVTPDADGKIYLETRNAEQL